MNKFLFQSVLFVILVFIIDIITFKILQIFRPVDYQLFVEAKKEYFISPSKFDMLILGDSHVSDAIDPRVIEETFGIKAFNLSVYHASPFETFYLFKNALQNSNQNIATLVYGTNPKMFTRDIRPGKYTPLILRDWHLTLELYRNAQSKEYMNFLFKSFKEKYLFTALYSKISNKTYKPIREIRTTRNGYLETTNQIESTEWQQYTINGYAPIKTLQVDYFINIIELAKINKIKMIIVNPPIWYKWESIYKDSRMFVEYKRTIDSLADHYRIQQYTAESDAYERKEFLNIEHLNYYGASKFTTRLVTWLDSIP